MVTGHIIYCGHGFMDNFLIVLAYQKSCVGHVHTLTRTVTLRTLRAPAGRLDAPLTHTRAHTSLRNSTDGPAVRRTVGVVLFICLIKAVLLIVYSDRDLGCGWCSTFFPVPQAGYMDMALAACYVFMCISVYVPKLEWCRPRTTILPWILFMAVSCECAGRAAPPTAPPAHDEVWRRGS